MEPKFSEYDNREIEMVKIDNNLERKGRTKVLCGVCCWGRMAFFIGLFVFM